MFLFPNHQARFEQFIEQDGTHPKDRERHALFYILSGYEDLGDKVEHLYDFESRIILPEGFANIDLTSSSKALAGLAFNLYNNFPCGTVVDVFASLDERNRLLAVEAIKLRFGVV